MDGNTKITFSPKIWIPRQIEEAWKLKQELGQEAIFIAGGTWIQLRWESGEKLPNHIIHLGKIDALNKVQLSADQTLSIGTFTTLAACRSRPDIQKYWPILAEAARNVASPAVRNQGTIGGNIACGFGDIIPALLVLGATITWFDGSDYITDEVGNFLKNSSAKIVTKIHLPKSPKTKTFYKKIGRREAFTPSLLTVAGTLAMNERNKIEYVRLAVGGGVIVPSRLLTCESMLQNQVPNEELWQKAHAQILQEFQPLTDRFASSHYLKLVAANLLIAGLTESLS